MYKYYEIAGIVIQVTSPFTFSVPLAKEFETDTHQADFFFRFEKAEDISKKMGNAQFLNNDIWAHDYIRPDGSYFRAFPGNGGYFAISEICSSTEGVCFYSGEELLMEKNARGVTFFNYLNIEQILLRFGCLVLHSSHICVENKGIVFTAPSQTGKSTQAELWRKYENGKIINGDRTVLRKINGCWYACGCPMHGTSNIHLNEKEPLSEIVLLSQGNGNRAVAVSGLTAFRFLYSQIAIPRWDKDALDCSMELINDLINEIPVWEYSCTQNPDAVSALKNVFSW